MNDRVTFKIKAHLGVLQENQSGWNKEINLVSWNDGPAKFDIRDWDPEHERMSRGVTISEKEMNKLLDIVAERAKDIKSVFDKEKSKKKPDIEPER